jgi:peptidoglycan/LPS O-acetylase OafA/YrhL
MFTGATWWIGALSSITITAVLALLMYGLVEKPSQRLAAWLGARISAALEAVVARRSGPSVLPDRLAHAELALFERMSSIR